MMRWSVGIAALAGAAAAQSPAPDPAVSRVSVHLTRGADWAAIPYAAAHGLILLPARVQGHAVSVLLDNGTERTLIDSAFARRTGTVLRASSLGADAGRSRIPAQLADAVTIELPRTLSLTGQVPAIDLAPVSALLGQPVAAVIGGDLLDRLAVMVRPGRREVAIVASGGITPGSGAIVIPVRDGNRIEAMLDGHPVRLKIDLGASGSIRLTDTAFDRIVPAGASAADGTQTTGDGVTRTTRTARADLRLGALSAAGVPIDSGYDGPGVDGLLGNGFLSHADTLLDFARGRLVLTPGAAAP